MYYVGQLEFNKESFHVDGHETYLFANSVFPVEGGKETSGEFSQTNFYMSPISFNPYIGDNFVMKGTVTAIEFLKWFCATDARHSQDGKSIIQSFKDCKVKFKGMKNWIEFE